jgi:hypothetical protein
MQQKAKGLGQGKTGYACIGTRKDKGTDTLIAHAGSDKCPPPILGAYGFPILPDTRKIPAFRH